MANKKDSNVEEVVAELKNFTDKKVKQLILEVTATLIEDTPVKTGWAQSNWIPKIGSPLSEPVGSKENVTKSEQEKGVAIIATKYKVPDIVYISNVVEYIVRLNEGTSTQAPSGFVQNAIAKAIAKVI